MRSALPGRKSGRIWALCYNRAAKVATKGLQVTLKVHVRATPPSRFPPRVTTSAPSPQEGLDLLPFLCCQRLRLPPLEFAVVHTARPRESHRGKLRQVAEGLPHPALAFAIAIEED